MYGERSSYQLGRSIMVKPSCNDLDCRPKRNGNMPHVEVLINLLTHGEDRTSVISWVVRLPTSNRNEVTMLTMTGFKQLMYAHTSLMALVFSAWPEMSQNGRTQHLMSLFMNFHTI